MFGKNDKKAASQSNGKDTIPTNGILCVIAKGTSIEGDLVAEENIRIDGNVIGDINCKKKLVMGPSGMISGKVNCNDSSIEGKIVGEIKVFGRLHLHSSANVEGKIVANKLIVDEGAGYSGECLIGEQHLS